MSIVFSGLPQGQEKVGNMTKILKHARFCMFKFTKFSQFPNPSNGKKNIKISLKSD